MVHGYFLICSDDMEGMKIQNDILVCLYCYCKTTGKELVNLLDHETCFTPSGISLFFCFNYHLTNMLQGIQKIVA